jgi:hypothetical protein
MPIIQSPTRQEAAMATRKAAAKKSSAVKTVTLADIQEKFGSKGARISASSAQKKYDAKWDKFEKKTLKKVDKDIKKTIKEMKQLTI